MKHFLLIKSKKTYMIVAAIMLAATMLVSFSLPAQADALEVVRWSARANESGGSKVLGATSTRITFQAQAEAEESIADITLKLPEGTLYEVENTTVTVLDGLTRLSVESNFEMEDDLTIKVTFPEATPAGTMVMIELNRILLPGEGGSFGIDGTYTLVEGSTTALPNAPATIDVEEVSLSEQMAAWVGEQEWYETWTSVKFLNVFFNPAIAITSVPKIIEGWGTSLLLVVTSFPLAIPLGLIWCFLRMSKNKLLRGIGSLYINVVRGTPVFLQIYIAFFGLPLLDVNLPPMVLAVIVLMMNSSAYLAEIFRAGIQSIDKGQFEAARSLGMSRVKTMFFVIIPQTVQRVIPTMTSELILLYKDTALLAAVGIFEMMMFSKTITADVGNMTPYIIAAGFYLVVTLPLTKVINILEERMADRQVGKMSKKVKKQQANLLEEETV